MRTPRLPFALGLLSLAAASSLGACEKSTTGDNAATAAGNDGGTNDEGDPGWGNAPPSDGGLVQGTSSKDPGQNATDAASPTTCQFGDVLQILYAPSYSAFDGVHSFKVPMVIPGVDNAQITWTTSDDTKVRHTRDDSFGGEMFETLAAGDVTIFAGVGNVCGHSVLHITQATPDQWQKGSDRYHNGVFVKGLNNVTRPDGGRGLDCSNCHGVKDTSTQSLGTVEHTPMQTAGFSDTDLQNIFRHGTTPNGALAQPLTNITYQMWQSFHQWQVVDEAEAQGLVIYLRSITPAPTGNADFGGAFGQGGARPKGDGGTKPPRPNDGG